MAGVDFPSQFNVGGKFPLDLRYWVADISNLNDGQIYEGMHRWVRTGQYAGHEFRLKIDGTWEDITAGNGSGGGSINVQDSLDGSSTTNAPSVRAVNEALDDKVDQNYVDNATTNIYNSINSIDNRVTNLENTPLPGIVVSDYNAIVRYVGTSLTSAITNAYNGAGSGIFSTFVINRGTNITNNVIIPSASKIVDNSLGTNLAGFSISFNGPSVFNNWVVQDGTLSAIGGGIVGPNPRFSGGISQNTVHIVAPGKTIELENRNIRDYSNLQYVFKGGGTIICLGTTTWIPQSKIEPGTTVIYESAYRKLLTTELNSDKSDYAGLNLLPLLIKIVNAIGTGTTTPPDPSTPTITSVNPASGPVGTTVTITGTNLSNATLLKLGNTDASILTNTANSITFNVPNGATSGTISFVKNSVTTTSSTIFNVTADSIVPMDRSRKISLSDTSYNKAQTASTRVLNASAITFNNGEKGISPGTGNPYYYVREWARDSAMARIGHLDYFTALEIQQSFLRFMNARTSDNWIPDRIKTDLSIERVPFDNIVRSPLDNGLFWIENAYLHYLKTGSASLYGDNKVIADAVVLSTEIAQSGDTHEIPYIEDQAVGSTVYTEGFGFYDSEYLSGTILYTSALYYRACRRLAELNIALGNTVDANNWIAKAGRIKAAVNDPITGLWDASYGMFRAASIKGSEVHDLPGNALAVETGLADDDKALAISTKLNSVLSSGVFRGGVRHIAEDDDVLAGFSSWRYFVDIDGKLFQVLDDNGNKIAKPGGGFYSGSDAGTTSPYGEYQNGGYWYTFVREILTTLAITNEQAAKQFLFDSIYYANLDISTKDNVECFSKNGLFRCTQYAASAAGIFGAVVGGGTDPNGPTPDPVTGPTPAIIGEGSFEHDSTNSLGNVFIVDNVNTWGLGTDSVYSNGTGLFWDPESAVSVITSQVMRLSGQYAHFDSPSNPDLGITQIRMIPVVNGIDGTPTAWEDISLTTTDTRSHNVRWASNALTGDYYFQFRGKGVPDSTKFTLFDRFFTSNTRTAPIP